MAKLSLRNTYLYLVCLVTLVVFITGTILTITNLVDLVLDNNYYQSRDDYALRFQKYPEPPGYMETPSEAEIDRRYLEYIALEKRRQRNQDISNFAKSIAAMLVGGGFWIYHWRKIEDEHEGSS